MAAEAGLSTIETFFSDGHEGNLNLYAVLSRVNEAIVRTREKTALFRAA